MTCTRNKTQWTKILLPRPGGDGDGESTMAQPGRVLVDVKKVHCLRFIVVVSTLILVHFAVPPNTPVLWAVPVVREKREEHPLVWVVVLFKQKISAAAWRCILLLVPQLAGIGSWACGPCRCMQLTKLICSEPAPTGEHQSLKKVALSPGCMA